MSTIPAETSTGDGASPEAAILRVLRGNPNPAEVAALVLALAHVRARNAALDGDPPALPTAASWDRPSTVYRSPASWMSMTG